ncbi:MAG: hypothetical protein P8R54_16340 [Myxococcota bacterium]|nr:hypothetical protein [Myxococcota bacterium]
MAEKLLEIGDGFWNIRGDFRIGVLNIGTQASLVRLSDGRFVLLDAYTLPDALLREVKALTGGGKDIDAIINLHPFHTIHVKRAHAQFPGARLFGSARHVAKAPQLPWQDLRVDGTDALSAELGGELAFSVPDGVDFISEDESVHFSSVLAYHSASQTIHVDDTFNHVAMPLFGGLSLHPTLGKALKKEKGAAGAFRTWASGIADDWGGARNLCAAHTSPLLGVDNLGDQMRAALSRSERKLRAHERRQR